MVVADGRPATIDLPIECRPSGMLRVRIVDDATGEPTAARVYLRDDVGPAWPVGATIRRDDHGNAFFHAEGTFEARVSGTARLRVVRGIEYEAAEFELPVRADAEVDAPVRLRALVAHGGRRLVQRRRARASALRRRVPARGGGRRARAARRGRATSST